MEARIDVGLVRDVVAGAFEEANQRQLPAERALRTGQGPVERPVERHLDRLVTVGAREWIQALAAPAVVRLPGVDGNLDEHCGGRPRLPNDQVRRRRAARLWAVEQERSHEVV